MYARGFRRSASWRCVVGALLLGLALAGQARAQEEIAPPTRPAFGAPSSTPDTAPVPLRAHPEFGRALPLGTPVAAPLPLQGEVPRALIGQPQTKKPEPAKPKPPPEKEKAEPEAPGSLQLNPPSPELLFRLESEHALRQRMRNEALANPKLPKPEFPIDRPQTPGTVAPRAWSWYVWEVEPTYLCHGRLYFEQPLAERRGVDFGVMHPLISATIFSFDVVTMPLRILPMPCPNRDCRTDSYSAYFSDWPIRP